MGGRATRAHSSLVTALCQTHAALDALYNLLLARLRAVEPRSELGVTLERLCRTARAQDDALPLALLPVWSCAAAGGHEPQRALGIAAAWRSLHLAGKLLNDAGNDCPSALLPNERPPGMLNVGVGLIFLAQATLAEATARDIPPSVALTLQAEFARAGLQAAAAQHTRLRGDADRSWANYQAIVARRSGGPFSLAMRAGALLQQGERTDEGGMTRGALATVQALADYGHHLGLMLQLADDFNGVWRPRGRSDLATGRPTWPLLYAEALADAHQRARLSALVRRAPGDPAAEAAARALLVQLDVPLAMVLATEEQRSLAEAALEPLGDSEARRTLVALVRRATLAPEETQR